jgi:hypothetical protein
MKFPELKELPTQELVDKLTAERDVLAVQVKQLRDAVDVLGCYAPDEVFEDLEPALKWTPTQYLAAHDAEVAAKAIEEAINSAPSRLKYNLALVDVCDLYDYANQLRQADKGGEGNKQC